mmetsp:Transcript_13129/g.38643  ORF Transcript_13129/g.38643 Transcript_13129/m.38643 type:complete len:449 (-) Transcript_13129:2075-3421(-)
MSIAHETLPLLYAYVRDFKLSPALGQIIGIPSDDPADLQKVHAAKLREALTRLGPAFVKVGQQLSIRPDLMPPLVLTELQKLCDNVQPVPEDIAMEVLKEDLGFETDAEVKVAFDDMKLVASASLGQVYKAKIKSTGQEVAIKVQRPDMQRKVSLDLFLLNKYGELMDSLCNIFTEQIPYHVNFIDCFSRGSYSELDYEKEALNQKQFKKEFQKRKCKVHVPNVFDRFSARRVITTEWVDGVKLADAPVGQIRSLIPVGVELFLTQLLDMGKFHADPHPGNLYVTRDGMLCLLDFGLCAEVDERSRHAMTTAIVHLLQGDFDTLIAKDAKKLGFLPEHLDTTEIKPVLTKILTQGLLESGSSMQSRKRKLMEISSELNEVFFKYPFSVPPFFALVTRGLGLLEGIALSGDPDFDIFNASYPYARKRAVEIFGYTGLRKLRRQVTNIGA